MSVKKVPDNAVQHTTAGPYSPVLEIDCRKLIVLSGQAALDHEGRVVGDTIEEQTRKTLENCAAQLQSAGCTMKDVFKVNVYFSDIGLWENFNRVYMDYIPNPYPVRTAIETKLLPGLLVEIEMWAAK